MSESRACRPLSCWITSAVSTIWEHSSATADAAAIEKLYLCGITGQPPQRAITKTALGAEETVAWEHSWDAVALIHGLRERGPRNRRRGNPPSMRWDLFDWSPRFPVCVIFGHEVDGIRPEVSQLCDTHVRLPMLGLSTPSTSPPRAVLSSTNCCANTAP